MTPFEAFLGALPSIDVLVGFDKRAAVAAGVSPSQASSWAGLHEVYYGTTRFTAKQREALKLAGAFSLEQLVYIERRLKAVDGDAERWQARLDMLARPGTFHTLKDRADEVAPQKPKPREESLRMTQSIDGFRGLYVWAEERKMANLDHKLFTMLDDTKPVMPQNVANFFELLGSGGVAEAVPRPQVLIPLPQYTQITQGLGDDTVLRLTDGTTMTGAEYLAKFHGGALEVALFHPKEGPVNLYDTQRSASAKQRDLARLVLPGCPVPGCRRGADQCEAHHVKAWKHGGATNMSNLAMLCRYHNRTNDDDDHLRRRGRIVMVNHTPVWCSPHGYQVRTKHHRFGAMYALFGV